ncbi:MAG: response regulator, partial [Pseudomonadota bacterium]
NPFFTTKPVGEGTGLGLSLSRTIVEQYGGEIRYSRTNNRTVFCLFFPIQPVFSFAKTNHDSSESLPSPTSSNQLSKNKQVLLVDDEEEIRDFLKYSLENEGYQVFDTDNGKNALEIVRANPIELVISDLKVPEMDGVEFATKAKALFPRLPIFILTGSPGYFKDVTPSLVDRFFSKPTKTKDLVEAVNEVLNGVSFKKVS